MLTKMRIFGCVEKYFLHLSLTGSINNNNVKNTNVGCGRPVLLQNINGLFASCKEQVAKVYRKKNTPRKIELSSDAETARR